MKLVVDMRRKGFVRTRTKLPRKSTRTPRYGTWEALTMSRELMANIVAYLLEDATVLDEFAQNDAD